MLFAAIEVGSYEMELAVYEIGKKGIHAVDRVNHVLGLGTEIFRTGRVGNGMLAEICRVLTDFGRIMEMYKVTDYRACATTAIREAANGIRILDQIEVRTGIRLEALSNSEQRFLHYKGFVMHDGEMLSRIDGDSLILDIGSGSMQISVLGRADHGKTGHDRSGHDRNGHDRNGHDRNDHNKNGHSGNASENLLENTQNLRIGSLRLRELLSEIRETRSGKNRYMTELLETEIRSFCRMWISGRRIENLIGVGDYLSYFNAKVLGDKKTFLSREEVDRYCKLFTELSPEELAGTYSMTEDKAALLVPCLICYRIAMEVSGAERFYVPDLTFCDCLAASWAHEQKLIRLEHSFDDDLINQAQVLAMRYQSGRKHSQNLMNNAGILFDALKKYHGLGKRARLLLQLAALLHDCGRFINQDKAGECSGQIIRATEIIGISHAEREMIATVVSLHCRDEVYDEDRPAQFSEKEYRTILKLAAILRIANALDRTHHQKLKDLKVSFKNEKMVLTVDAPEDFGLEVGLFEQKAELFTEIYGIRPTLKQRKK